MRLTTYCLQRYFKRFVERERMKATSSFDVWNPIQGWRRLGKRKWYYSEKAPWTEESAFDNQQGYKTPVKLVQPIEKWQIFKGDRVEVLVGRDKGKQGIVKAVVKERNWCFVEGLHFEYEEVFQTSESPGTIMIKSKPLLVTTEVALVDPSDNLPGEVAWRYTEDGEPVRVSVRTGRVIPLPDLASFYDDGYVNVKNYKKSSKDTDDKDLQAITFKPKLCTFEEDILEQHGIQEERKPAKTYWY